MHWTCVSSGSGVEAYTAQSIYTNLHSQENSPRTHKKHMLALSCTGPSAIKTMIKHFHSAVTEPPRAIFTEISQWRWCYVTAAMDPAVHITNASHCVAGSRALSRPHPGASSSIIPAVTTAEPQSLRTTLSHAAASTSTSTEQPCSAPLHPCYHSLTQHWR